MAGGDELPFASGKGRIVDQDAHANRRRIDVDKLQRLALLAIGQCFADVNFLEAGEADDVAGAGVLRLDLLQACIGEERGDVGALAAAVAMDANDGIADRDATADDPPESDAAEVIAVVKIGDEHLEMWLGAIVGGGMYFTIASKSGVMSSLFSCTSRMAKPFFALA